MKSNGPCANPRRRGTEPMREFRWNVGVALSLIVFGVVSSRSQESATFESAVVPVIRQTCSQCHNETVASGGLNLKALDRRETFVSKRADWETVLRKLKAGEMPPPNVPKPAGLAAMTAYIERELDRLDRNVKPDPGRVTARRLNRTEYRNTIRDLMGVDYDSEQEFPPDDTGYGFDDIADVL